MIKKKKCSNIYYVGLWITILFYKKDMEKQEVDKVIEKWNEILNTVKKEHEISDVSFDTWMRPL